jgi:hypothetical protein
MKYIDKYKKWYGEEVVLGKDIHDVDEVIEFAKFCNDEIEERVTELERRLNERDELENTADLRIDTYSCGNNRIYRVTNLDTGRFFESRNKLEAIREARK